MKLLSGHEIKKVWLEFFQEKGHKIEDGASLVPINDPTLLWINAGVAALKGYFDGTKIPENPRIVNAQKCIRTNDIDNVGLTARHHTFFEMLGNFSIGDYFRDEAIEWAYEILTSDKYYGFDPDKLFITVYPSDHETKNKWIEVGMKEEHIVASENNFWEIGSGPCGPCTEIYYDRGDTFGKADLSMVADDIENDRYIEVWNIVLSQFNAKAGLTREEYPELPNKNIDTGMGLERMACIIQGKETNFETDLFFPLIKQISKIANKPYDGSMAFKVIADHMRTVTFAISDGATLSNEGRGYVLRRLLRRAIKYGRQLGIERPFLKELVDGVVKMMEESYPYLHKTVSFTKQVIEKEEKKFLETLNQGEKILDQLLQSNAPVLEGKDVFMLYDTYGFPVELTEEYASAKGKKIDHKGFLQEMQMQKDRARNARKVISSMKNQNEAYLNFKEPSRFVGYDVLETTSKVLMVFEEGIVVEETPFYAESGGQVSDRGILIKNGESYEVLDVEKLPNGQHLHVLENHPFSINDPLTLKVDKVTRQRTMAHHSVTHLLYQTLRAILGDHITQQGSLVGPDYLRFDFSHFELLDDATLLNIEQRVNEMIQQNIKVHIEHTELEKAKKRGAIAEFGEKYDSKVRLVDMGGTLDLCGGTHVENTADIERFAIAGVESKGSGIYRITALAHDRVFAIGETMVGIDENIGQLKQKAELILDEAVKYQISLSFKLPKETPIRGSYQDVINKRKYNRQLQNIVKKLDRAYQDAKDKQLMERFESYIKQAENGNIVIKTEGYTMDTAKNLADRLMEHLKGGVVFIANIEQEKLLLIAKSKSDIHAGNLVKEAAKIAGGGGGGKSDFAQAGARNLEKTDDVIAYVKGILS